MSKRIWSIAPGLCRCNDWCRSIFRTGPLQYFVSLESGVDRVLLSLAFYMLVLAV